jgi:nucleoside-diphosphate-sugar epimerase
VTAHDPVDARPWLILGCGYTGEVLARQLVAPNAQVTIVRRDAAALAAIAARVGKARAVVANLADAASLSAVASLARDANVVQLAPPATPDGSAEASLARALVDAGAHRLVYISTSGVYGAAKGARVDEDWPTAPATPAGEARLAAERAIEAAGLAHVILRAPGIYGPGRGVAARLRAGTYRIIGDGAAHVSRVHVEDLARAIVLAATATDPPRTIYNVADRDPCTAAEHGDGVAAMLQLPPPPRVPAEQVTPEVAGMLLADRRLDASRLERELGWTPRYPSWRDALAAELVEP